MHSFKKFFLALALFSLLVFVGCDTGGGTDCYYDIGSSTDIASVRVFYPCSLESSTAVYDATTLSGGMTNVKEHMYWLAETLVQNGNMIVFAVSAENNLTVPAYTRTHHATFQLMKSENNNPESPLYHRIGKLALTGYSMGGGAVLNVANDLGNEVDAVIALAPFNPENTLNNLTAATLMMVGQNDPVAPKGYDEAAYEDISDSVSKCMIQLDNFGHMQWVNNSSSNADTPRLMVVDWLNLFLKGKESARQTFLNPPADVVTNWNNL